MDRLSYKLHLKHERANRLSLEHFGCLAKARAFTWLVSNTPISEDLGVPLGVVGVLRDGEAYVRGVVYPGTILLSQREDAELRPILGLIWASQGEIEELSFEQMVKEFEDWTSCHSASLVESMSY